MRRFIICAAVNYEQPSSELFFNYSQRRAGQLLKGVPRGEDARVDLYDFKSGSVQTRSITWTNGKLTEHRSTKKPFRPITMDDYIPMPGTAEKFGFKDGRTGVMSILDIYDAIAAIGREQPNNLEEVSIFSHAYLQGPIMVNSYDDRVVKLPAALQLGTGGQAYRDIQGTERDPDDMDCRAQYDFTAPTAPPDRLAVMRIAFSSRGRIWTWGCNFDWKANSVLSAVRRAIAGRTDLGDDTVLVFKNLTKQQLASFAEFRQSLKIDRDAMYRTRSCAVTFKGIKQAMWDKISASYAFQAAQGIKVPAIGAIFGTYASFDQGNPELMSISADTASNVSLYRKYFGIRTDDEGRNYGVFTHDMKMI